MNHAKLVTSMKITPDFIDRARTIYRELRELTFHENSAAASALGVTPTTLTTYRRRAQKGEDPFAEVLAAIEAEELDYIKSKMSGLVSGMEKESPSQTRKVLFPRLAAETDRAIDGARMAGWVLKFLEEFQEEMRAEVERLASEQLDEHGAGAAVGIIYQALDSVIEKHGKEAEAER